MNTLYITIGISGCGKSTYIEKHFNPEIVVSPDELRKKFTGDISDQSQNAKIWAVVPKYLKQRLEKYGEAVLDATNVDSGGRGSILKNFSRDLVKRVAIVFDADPEESKRRIHADIEQGKSRSVVPDDVIDKQYKKFKNGYNTISQQFDEVINGNTGGVEMKPAEKIREIVKEQMKRLAEEDADEAKERAQYQSYQDMYLTPQSNWKLKKYAPMLSAKGGVYKGKLGEIHKIQTVEYDLFHTGEVVTELNGETYSIDAEDFRECFDQVNDEEGQKISNDSMIKEEIKKLSKIKDYFGKNIRESIEKLETAFLSENKMNIYNDIRDHGKRTVTLLYDGNFDYQEVKKYMKDNYDTNNIEVLDYKKPSSLNDNEGTVSVKINKFYDEHDEEPSDDSYLEQDYEDRVSGDGYED